MNKYGLRTEEGFSLLISEILGNINEGVSTEETILFFFNRLPTWRIPIDGQPINETDIDIITDMVLWFLSNGADDGEPHYLVPADLDEEERKRIVEEKKNYDGSAPI